MIYFDDVTKETKNDINETGRKSLIIHTEY